MGGKRDIVPLRAEALLVALVDGLLEYGQAYLTDDLIPIIDHVLDLNAPHRQDLRVWHDEVKNPVDGARGRVTAALHHLESKGLACQVRRTKAGIEWEFGQYEQVAEPAEPTITVPPVVNHGQSDYRHIGTSNEGHPLFLDTEAGKVVEVRVKEVT